MVNISYKLVILLWTVMHHEIIMVKFVVHVPPDKLGKTHIYWVPDNIFSIGGHWRTDWQEMTNKCAEDCAKPQSNKNTDKYRE